MPKKPPGGKSIRIAKLEKVALQRASSVVLFEMSDPRLGKVTLTRADLANDLSAVTLFYSVLGTPADRSKVAHALRAATGHVQREVAAVFHTQRCPVVRFEFDPSIEGAVKMGAILDRLSKERDPSASQVTGAGGETGGSAPGEEE